jgi:hypothetical protein
VATLQRGAGLDSQPLKHHRDDRSPLRRQSVRAAVIPDLL